MYCLFCGKEVPIESRFCPECGEDLRVARLQWLANRENIDLENVTIVHGDPADFAPRAKKNKKKGRPGERRLGVILALILLAAAIAVIFLVPFVRSFLSAFFTALLAPVFASLR